MASFQDYQLTLYSEREGFQLVNTFFYINQEGGMDASEISAAFIVNVLPSLANIVPNNQKFYRVYVKNLVLADNFSDETIDVDGSRVSAIDNTWNRWYFKFKRSTNGYNDGRKLIGLVSDTDVADFAPTATALEFLQLAATAMSMTLTASGSESIPANARYALHPADDDHEKPYYVLSFLEPIRGVEFVRLSHKV